jgi:redox-sensitive bicupin YhaK (pirin superfamily)
VGIDIRPGQARSVTQAEGRTTRHSFSFGSVYDPANLGFAALTAYNDESLPPGTGYPDHSHSDVEIVTWVLDGALRHSGTDGSSGVLLPGDVQRISAGAGIVHAEVTEPGVHTRFVQAWLRPDQPGGQPSYAVERGASSGTLTEVVGPSGLAVGVAGARLLLAGDATGEIVLPDAPRLHVFVAGGRVELAGAMLAAGDAARLSEAGARSLDVVEPATVAVWAFAV